MLDPRGRVVMVSGASRGMGLKIAHHLHDLGYHLSLGGRDLSALEGVVGQRVGGRVSLHVYDAHDPAAAAAWVSATIAEHGRLDGLVNNAGILRDVRLEGAEDESELDAMWQVNVKAPVHLVRQAWPHLKASGSGRVVNMASMSGKRIAGNLMGYSLTKYAMAGLTEQIRHDGWDHGIRATAICPGYVATDMAYALTDLDPEKMTQPEDVAALVATALALPNTASVPEMMVNYRYEPIT